MNDYLKKIKKILVEKAGVEPAEITDNSYFYDDLNLGEIEMMEIITELEDAYEVTLPEDEVEEVESVGDLVNLLIEHVE